MIVPDGIEPVVGWRAWMLGFRPGLLSITRPGMPWPTREPLRAMCQSCATAPGEKCECGIYAVRDFEDLPDYGLRGFPAHGITLAVGTVALWGRVIPGTRGWRAEYAYPVALHFVLPFECHTWHEGRAVIDAYGVPAYEYPTVPEMFADLGITEQMVNDTRETAR